MKQMGQFGAIGLPLFCLLISFDRKKSTSQYLKIKLTVHG